MSALRIEEARSGRRGAEKGGECEPRHLAAVDPSASDLRVTASSGKSVSSNKLTTFQVNKHQTCSTIPRYYFSYALSYSKKTMRLILIDQPYELMGSTHAW